MRDGGYFGANSTNIELRGKVEGRGQPSTGSEPRLGPRDGRGGPRPV